MPQRTQRNKIPKIIKKRTTTLSKASLPEVPDGVLGPDDVGRLLLVDNLKAGVRQEGPYLTELRVDTDLPVGRQLDRDRRVRECLTPRVNLGSVKSGSFISHKYFFQKGEKKKK